MMLTASQYRGRQDDDGGMSQQAGSQQAGSQRAPTVEHSALGQVTIFTAVLALGLMWTLAAAGVWDMPDQVPWAVSLGILGIGLLIGAFMGRARWLTWVCIPVAFCAAGRWQPDPGPHLASIRECR